MNKPNTTEANFETEYVVSALKENGYVARDSSDYDKHLCLDTELVLEYIQETQAEKWSEYKDQRQDPEEKILKRISDQVRDRGVLDVLREGVKDHGHHFDLLAFKPASGLNPEHQKDYEANTFSVINQLMHSDKTTRSLDVALFVNGIPLFLMELKNNFTNQDHTDAIRQWKHDRDPREPLFKRSIAMFALDNDTVYYTTELDGQDTDFLPFNKGIENSDDPRGFKVAYLYRDILAPDSVLNLLEKFIFDYEGEDGDEFQVFPRYHQLDTVRRLIDQVGEDGPGENYLIQHSAGSGKTFTISWLAHQLSELYDDANERVFDSVVVISDRRVIDKQLKKAVREFEQTVGTVVWAQRSADLREALETGKDVVVTTLQKFPYALEEIEELNGSDFAVLIDEAHSGQGGKLTQTMNETLQYDSLDEAEEAEVDELDLEEKINQDVKSRQMTTDNISYFAFTATPKRETIELFGTRNKQGEYEPFSLYSMKQAIAEGFILDVLENYMSYNTYFQLSKEIEDNEEYKRRKAKAQLVRYANLEKDAIEKKVEVMLDHFESHTNNSIGGQGKAMLVTRSRLHVVRYKRV